MFLKLGRFFLFSPFRYLVLLVVLASFLGVQLYLYIEKQKIHEEAFYLSQLIHKAEATRKQRAVSQKKLKELAKADPDFLQRFSENFPLRSNNNQAEALVFLTEKKKKNSHFLETFYQQQKEVCLKKEGFEKLLAHLEKVPIDHFYPDEQAPNFIITRMELQKKQNDFQLYLYLLERKVNP